LLAAPFASSGCHAGISIGRGALTVDIGHCYRRNRAPFFFLGIRSGYFASEHGDGRHRSRGRGKVAMNRRCPTSGMCGARRRRSDGQIGGGGVVNGTGGPVTSAKTTLRTPRGSRSAGGVRGQTAVAGAPYAFPSLYRQGHKHSADGEGRRRPRPKNRSGRFSHHEPEPQQSATSDRTSWRFGTDTPGWSLDGKGRRLVRGLAGHRDFAAGVEHKHAGACHQFAEAAMPLANRPTCVGRKAP